MKKSQLLSLILIPLLLLGISQCDLINKANATTSKDSKPVTEAKVKKESTEEKVKPVKLTQAQIDNAGVRVAKVGEGDIYKTIELLGEIVLNEETTTHISPRYAGSAVEVRKRLGDMVEKGDVLAVIENKETFTRFKVVAPMSGQIVAKHITNGEIVSEDSEIFTIADLSEVWVNFEVNLKDAQYVRTGQAVTIKAIGIDKERKALLSFVSPILDPETRCIIARAEISNKWGHWKPGMFVKGTFTVKAAKKVKRVLRSAVQVLHQKNCVFVPTKDGAYIPVYVKMVESNKIYAQVECDGLKIGDQYVTRGAFALKSKAIFGNRKASCPCC